MDYNNQEKTLIFLHNPRTGGTTLTTTIERLFPIHAVFPGSLATRLTRRSVRIRLLWGGLRTSQQITDSLGQASKKDKRKIMYLHGHLPFGVHALLPKPCTYVTMLRDPVERIISLYHFLRRRPDMAWYDLLQDVNLRDFVADMDACGCNNNQVRRISGIKPDEPLTADTLERAKENLTEHFTVVGLTERFNETLLLLSQQFGWNWRDLLYFRRNAGKHARDQEVVSLGVTDLIRQRNQLDLALYQFAQQQFEQSVREQGASFQDRLIAFEKQLALFQARPPGRVWNQIKRLAIDLHIQALFCVRRFGSAVTFRHYGFGKDLGS